MAKNGSAILIACNTGTPSVPAWTVIPCQMSGEYSLSRETIDTSCKDSADNTNLPGAATRTISVESRPTDWPELLESPQSVEEKLRAAAEDGTQIMGAVVVDGDELEQFTATITSYTISAPREDSVTLSIELAISGGLTPIAAS